MGKLILRKEQEDEIIEYIEKICEIIGYCQHAPMDIETDLLAVIDDYTTTKIYKDIYFPIENKEEMMLKMELVHWLNDNGFKRVSPDHVLPEQTLMNCAHYFGFKNYSDGSFKKWIKSDNDGATLFVIIFNKNIGIDFQGSHLITKTLDKALASIKRYNEDIFEQGGAE